MSWKKHDALIKLYNALIVVYIGAIIFLVYLPIAHLILFSFNKPSLLYYPFMGWSFKWYKSFIEDPAIVSSLKNSLIHSTLTTVITLVVSTSAALGLRKRFRLQNLYFYMVLLGMIYPGVTLGLTNLIVDVGVLHVPLSIWTISFTVSVWCIPFGLIVLMMRFDPMLSKYEEAARVHGANEWKVFANVTFPLIKTELITVSLFAFTLALGEVFRSTFVAPPTSPVLPVLLLSTLASYPPTPKFFALGTVITVVSLLAIFTGGIIMTRRGGLLRRIK